MVVALTLNGALVHKLGEYVKPGLILAGLNTRTALWLNLAGVISSVSWIWACFVGTARAWNDKLPFSTIMAFYLANLAAGMAIAAYLHNYSRRKAA